MMKIKQYLRHLFIPHEHNEYWPHFFRELSVAIILFLSIFLLGFSAGSSYLIHKTVKGVTIAAGVLIDLANESRLAVNENPLTKSDLLDTAAQLKAEHMIANSYFAHDSPDGITPWYWFSKVNYNFLYAGENLAINFTEAIDVHNAWLNSPGHRANLLNINFREIGIATREGYYNGIPTIFVVQMFGTPAKAKAADTATTSTPPVSPKVTVPNVREIALTDDTNQNARIEGATIDESSDPILKDEQPKVENVIQTEKLAVVKNTEAEALDSSSNEAVTYSKWYERFLFSGSSYVDYALRFLILFVGLALVYSILIEYRKKHYKHLMYGVMMLLFLSILVYMNQGFL